MASPCKRSPFMNARSPIPANSMIATTTLYRSGLTCRGSTGQARPCPATHRGSTRRGGVDQPAYANNHLPAPLTTVPTAGFREGTTRRH